MMKFVFFFSALSFSVNCLSQSSTTLSTSNDVGSIAVLVQCAAGTGSGFYIQDTSTNFICLVTACHVVMNLEKGTYNAKDVFFISYKKNSQRDTRDSFKVSLLDADNAGMLKYDLTNDVFILKIATVKNRGINYLPFVSKLSNTNTYINAMSTNQFKKIVELETLTDVYTIGYPKSLTLTKNFDFNRPLVRHGIISGIDLNKNKIIADCPVYQGNSGGVVFQVDKFVTGQIFVIGVAVEFIPFEEHWKNEAYGYYNTNVYNSGYTVVTPIDAVIKLLNSLPK